MRRLPLVALAVSILSGPARSEPPAGRDWAAALRGDAQALHDDIAANHPGPFNREDPGFAARNDAQLRLVLARAGAARSHADYLFALRRYAGSFDDGHLGVAAIGALPGGTAWPGFLTNYDAAGVQRVMLREADAPVPLGARLTNCDGIPADRFAATRLGARYGRWSLEAQRRRWGGWLLVDEGSRYERRPVRCEFEMAGRRRVVRLGWRSIDRVALTARIDAARQAASYGFAARTLADGTRWYAMPSFNSDPGSKAAAALPGMIAAIRADRAALPKAPAIVLDVRGNGGGDSDWSRQIAEILWGRSATARMLSRPVHVDWRVSPANLSQMEQAFAERKRAGGLSPEASRWFETVTTGLRDAVVRGDQLWREPDDAPADEQAAMPPPPPLSTPIYLLTDGACGSACLDAVDLWRGLGAVHVGRTTSADTLYMDIRRVTLPSGLAAAAVPMKVYAGRVRGANEPVVPEHRFDGDISDTDAVEAWIAGLRGR